MIKHIVMWNVRGSTPAEKERSAQRVKQSFESLLGRIPGLLELEVGIDISRISYACDVLLYSVFSDEAALAAYAGHPEHLRVKEELCNVRTARYQVDYRVR